MQRRVLAIIVLLAVAALTAAHPARAEGGAVVRASEARINFPREISFRLDAESSAEIVDVQLQLNTPDQRYGAAVRNVRPSFTAGRQITASWSWPRWGNQLPPGALVTYRWRITDTDGVVTETAQSSVRVQDGRYGWQELSDGPITVRWYKGDERFGREVLAAAKESAARLHDLQGVDARFPLTVHVYGSQRELFDAVPGAPGWIGGIAIPEFDTVMIGIEPGNLPWGRRALTHEMAHQLVFQMTAHPTLGSRVPTWLNEGLAVVAEGETEARNRELIDEAVANGTVPTLRTLSTPFSAQSGHLAGVAYAASESAVRFLLERYGAGKMRELLLALADGLNGDQAARRTYGVGMDQLEDAWRIDLGLKPFDRGQPAGIGGDEPSGAAAAAVRSKHGASLLLWLGAALAALAVVAAAGGVWIVRRQLR